MKTYRITGKFIMYIGAKNKEEALETAYEELDEATNCTRIDAEVNEVEVCDE